METTLRAESGGTIAQIHVKPGATVSAKDLLITMEA